ncbi:MAG: hypothetical protein ACM30H_14620 [Clostridia bacterium]
MGEKTGPAQAGQVLAMAGIVATLLFFPVAMALAFGLRLAGIAVEPLATFGGALGALAGALVWWLIFFAGALVYVACLFPWGDQVLAWPKKK